MNQYERAIGHAAIRTFGRIPNIIKAIEELSELQQALCKHVVSEHDAMIVASVHEEIADVQIMLGRLMMLFDPTEVQDWKESKLEKMARMLGLDEATGNRQQATGNRQQETGERWEAVGAAMRRPPKGEGLRGTTGTSSVTACGCATFPKGEGLENEGPEEPTGDVLKEMRL